jgi:hypothetical protein
VNRDGAGDHRVEVVLHFRLPSPLTGIGVECVDVGVRVAEVHAVVGDDRRRSHASIRLECPGQTASSAVERVDHTVAAANERARADHRNL